MNKFKIGDIVVWHNSIYGDRTGNVTEVEGDSVFMDFDNPIFFQKISWNDIREVYMEPTHIVSCKDHYSFFERIE